MIDGKANDFIEELYYEDHYVIYNGEKFFFNGCQTITDKNMNVRLVRLEIYNLSKDVTVFSVTKPTEAECIEAMENAPIWDGKTFWEVENEFKWTDE